MVALTLCLFLVNACVVLGQDVARKQCEIYANGIDRIEIQKTVPNSVRTVRHIVGGVKSSPTEFPFMVALGYGQNEDLSWDCGGALISDRFVVTAAHCAAHRDLGPIKMARMGTTDLRVPLGQDPAQDIPVEKIATHPEYSPPAMYNDIALVKLSKPVRFSETTLPACLHAGPELNNVPVTAMGWGKLEFAGDSSNDLMKVTLSLIPREKCQETYRTEGRKLNQGIRSDIQMCAGSSDGSPKDTCQGDSGGPLQVSIGSKHFIVGITSFGKACGIAKTPGVYTKISAYVPWLESIVWE